jgi:hypothetical protein
VVRYLLPHPLHPNPPFGLPISRAR